MDKSLAMIEYATIATGMLATDLLAKTAEIELIQVKTVCPGKFIVLYSGELSAVKEAMNVVKARFPNKLLDCFVLGNPHDSLFEVLENPSMSGVVDTLGLIETVTTASAILAADIAVKSAKIQLRELRLAKSMCGKAYVLFSGSVASVEESVGIVSKQLAEDGKILDTAVISAPDEKFVKSLRAAYDTN